MGWMATRNHGQPAAALHHQATSASSSPQQQRGKDQAAEAEPRGQAALIDGEHQAGAPGRRTRVTRWMATGHIMPARRSPSTRHDSASSHAARWRRQQGGALTARQLQWCAPRVETRPPSTACRRRRGQSHHAAKGSEGQAGCSQRPATPQAPSTPEALKHPRGSNLHQNITATKGSEMGTPLSGDAS